jgi:GNAT superfamily N-acetyltransferase
VEFSRLTETDAAAALPLSAEAGWNQTEDDWRIFLARGHTFGIRRQGVLVATAAALPYDGFGFVGMVLTTAAWRHHGFATRLLACAVAALTDADQTAVLDATPAGRPVYERQGFLPIDALERWAGEATGTLHAILAPAAAVADLDALAFGARREFLLVDFLRRPGTIALIEQGGCALARNGSRATQIGPIVATHEAQALALLQRLLDRVRGPVFLDVPLRWTGLGEWLGRQGFRHQRPFTRMALHHARPFGDPARLFAAAGPEFG